MFPPPKSGCVSVSDRSDDYSFNKSTNVTARVLAAREFVQKHVGAATLGDGRSGVDSESIANGLGDHAEPLSKIVDEAEGERPVGDGRSDEKDSGNFGGLVVFRKKRRAFEASSAFGAFTVVFVTFFRLV